MGDRRCCCVPRSCLILHDDFDRSNSTNIGGNWVEVGGDSSIAGNELVIPAGGIVASVVSHPANDMTGQVTVRCVDMQVGKKYRALINYLDSTHYLYGEIEITTDSWLTAKVAAEPAGDSHTVTEVSYPGVGWDGYITICRTEEGLYMFTSPMRVHLQACIPDNKGRKVGMMNNGSGAIEFDDFYFYETQHTNSSPECPECPCECDNEFCIERILYLRIGAEGYCDCHEGAMIPLYYEPFNWPVVSSWYGSMTMQNDSCEDPPELWEWRLQCIEQDGGGQAFYLCYTIDDSTICTASQDSPCEEAQISAGDEAGEYASIASCDPLILYFGLYKCAFSGDNYCYYAFEVTE